MALSLFGIFPDLPPIIVQPFAKRRSIDPGPAPTPSSRDLTGLTFDRLKVLRRLPSTQGRAARWSCRCRCGRLCAERASQLLDGFRTQCSKSCDWKGR